MATPEVTVPFFKKKGKARPTTTRRQRSATPPGVGSSGAGPLASSSKTEVVLPQRKAAANLLSAGTKRKRIEDGAGADAADDDEDARNGPDVQWTAAGSHVDAARGILAGDEAEALAKRVRASAPESDEEALDDGLYHGQKGYKSHIKKSKEIPKSMRVGPQKNASTIRTVTMIDYQPDVCKDYKGAPLSSRSMFHVLTAVQRPAIVGSETPASSCTIEEPVRPFGPFGRRFLFFHADAYMQILLAGSSTNSPTNPGRTRGTPRMTTLTTRTSLSRASSAESRTPSPYVCCSLSI
jgi:hypothetical protein